MRSLLTSRRHPVRRPRCHHLLLGVVVITATINVFIGFNPLEQIEQQKQELQQDTKLKQPEQQEQQTNQEPYGQHEGEQEEQHQLQNEKEPEKHQLQNEKEPEKHQLQNEKEPEKHQLQNEIEQEQHQLQNEKEQEHHQLQNEKEQEQHQLQNEKEPEQHQLQNEKEPEKHQLQNEKEQEKHQLQNEKEQEKHQLQNEKEQEQHQLQNEREPEKHQLQNEKEPEKHQLKNEKKPEKHQLQNKTEQEQGGQEQEQEQSSHPWPSWKDHTGKCSIDGYLWKEEDRKNMRVEHADRLVQKYLLDWTPPLPDNLTQLWSKAADWVSFTHLYPEHTPEMGTVAKALATAKVINVTTSESLGINGVNFKLFITLAGGQNVLFKLKTADIYRIHNMSQPVPCALTDTHFPEIATFHMSRVLDFRRTPFAVGRKFDVAKEIYPAASPTLKKLITFRDHRTCVHEFCYEDGLMEGVMIWWLPKRVKIKEYMNPWGMICGTLLDHSYTHRWDKRNVTKNICNEVQNEYHLFKNKPDVYLHFVDFIILNHLGQNVDRKLHLGLNEHDHLVLMIDNARTFPNPDFNYEEFLAPLLHCCRVRESTYQTLLQLQNGTLSYVLEAVTGQDPVAPVLSQPQLRALDRRLHYVLAHIHHCVCKHGAHNVLIDM